MNNKLVAIRCLAYNHEKTIRQCLEGFVMQKTDFPFVAIVHDDASTDGTADIIREFEEKYPDIIKPIYETENQYSKQGALKKIMDDACVGYKYIALCEGDDYWTSPDKLQRQIEFLESHPEYSMCCCDAVVLTDNGERDWSISDKDTDLKIENLIKKGGLYIPTAGLVYRSTVKENYPECCKQCKVGDHPLQIMCGLKGKVRYMSDKMAAYRYAMGNSWSATRKNQDINKLMNAWKSSLIMLNGLNELSDFEHNTAFQEGCLKIILTNIGNNLEHSKLILKEMLKYAPECTKYANHKEKFKLFLIKYNLTFVWKLMKKKI